MELTILMPCLNEEVTIEFCIGEAKKFIEEYNLDAEILISDNGSTDNSVKLAEKMGARVVTTNIKGYGAALINGINNARGKYIIMGDCDGSYDFYHLYPMLEKVREGNHLVMGNRFSGGLEKGAMPLLHHIGVPVLSWIARKKFKTFIYDFHCGIRGFDRETALLLKFECMGMEFATEMIGKFAKNNCKIAEIPVVLRKDRRDRAPHLRTFRDGFRHLNYILFCK